MQDQFPQKFVRKILGDNAAKDYYSLLRKEDFAPLDPEEQDLKDQLNYALGQEASRLTVEDLDKMIPRETLQGLGSFMGSGLGSDDAVQSVLNKVLQESGYPGEVQAKNGQFYISNPYANQVVAINKPGFDLGDVAGMIGTGTNYAVPIAAGLSSGGLGALVAETGLQGLKEGVEQWAEPSRQNWKQQLGDIATVGGVGLGVNALGGLIGKGIGALRGPGKEVGQSALPTNYDDFVDVAKFADVPATATKPEASGPLEVLKSLVTAQERNPSGTLSKQIQANAGLELPLETLDRLAIEASSNPLDLALNKQQAGQIQEAGKNILRDVDLPFLKQPSTKQQIGKQIQERFINALESGKAEEKLLFQDALGRAAVEQTWTGRGAVGKTFDASEIADKLLQAATTASTTAGQKIERGTGQQIARNAVESIFDGLNPANLGNATSADLLKLGQNINSVYRNAHLYNLSDDELRILGEMRGRLMSDSDSLFNQAIKQGSDAVATWRKGSEAVIKRNDALQNVVYEGVIGKETGKKAANLATGNIARNVVAPEKAADNFYKLAKERPDLYKLTEEYVSKAPGGFRSTLDDLTTSLIREGYQSGRAPADIFKEFSQSPMASNLPENFANTSKRALENMQKLALGQETIHRGLGLGSGVETAAQKAHSGVLNNLINRGIVEPLGAATTRIGEIPLRAGAIAARVIPAVTSQFTEPGQFPTQNQLDYDPRYGFANPVTGYDEQMNPNKKKNMLDESFAQFLGSQMQKQ